MTGDRTAETLDDTVIEALQPQARRYDVAIEEGLVLSVLPNGVKTWTWVFDDPADPHRKTLGIYPDMTLEDARKSLTAERAAYRRASAEVSPEFVIRDGRIERAERSASQLPLIAGAAAAVVVALLLGWFLIGGDDEAETVTADEALLKPANPAAPSIQLPSIDNSGGSAAAADNTPAAAVADVMLPADNIGTDAVGSAQSSPPAAVSPAPVNEVLADAAATAEAVNDTPATTRAARPAADENSNNAPANGPEPAAPDVRESSITAGNIEVRVADAPAQSAGETRPAAGDTTAAAPVVTSAAIPSGLLLDGRVARGNLTTAVEQREPVDDLGTTIVGDGSDLQQYYFFTELRELAGQRVAHRWVQGDNIVAEIPFDVGEAWRWRVFSSKTFIPSMAGDWSVQVTLEDGTVIYNLPFTFSP